MLSGLTVIRKVKALTTCTKYKIKKHIAKYKKCPLNATLRVKNNLSQTS